MALSGKQRWELGKGKAKFKRQVFNRIQTKGSNAKVQIDTYPTKQPLKVFGINCSQFFY